MVFTVEEINNRTDILPGINLGYKIYDSCGSVEMTTRASLLLVNGNSSGTSCPKSETVKAVIGQTSSSPSIAISATVGPLNIPMVKKMFSVVQLFINYIVKYLNRFWNHRSSYLFLLFLWFPGSGLWVAEMF